MGFALGGKQLTPRADHLFKYRQAEDVPKPVAFALDQTRLILGMQHDQGVAQARNRDAFQPAQLLKRRSQRERREMRRLLTPSAGKYAYAAVFEGGLAKPGRQDGSPRSGRASNRIHEGFQGSGPTDADMNQHF